MHHREGMNAEPVRELVINVQLKVADYREAPPTDREIREYVGIIAETEYHESDMHIHDATVTGWGPQGG